LFGSSKSPKEVAKKLATLTGFAPMPPLYSLGFHFSKWSNINSSIMINRNANFELTGIPMDVLWFDIPHTNNGKYFTFNQNLFPPHGH